MLRFAREWRLAGSLTLLVLACAMSSPARATEAPGATREAGSHDAERTLTVGGAQVRVELDGDRFTSGSDTILDWIHRSATIVAAYYGHFPTPTVRIRVEPRSGGQVGGGTSYGWAGGFIRVQAGRDVTDAVLRDDWVLVHEMVHLALPTLDEQHAWLSEGLATYVEGIARVQAGNRREADVWAEYVRMMPRGLPAAGDRGLDNTHTWGRTYWGGAIYCLLADVEIRRRTEGRKGLQDALRAILEASGGLVVEWPIDRVLRTGDEAVGTTALQDLYARMRGEPMQPDLTSLWRDLGIERDGATVRLREDAPLSGVRRAIMRKPDAASP